MFFGSLLRLCSFAMSAGLVFLLSPQEPAMNWPHREQLSIWKEARATVFQGLRRVKADLDSSRKEAHHGRLDALKLLTVTTEPARIPSAVAAPEKAAVMGHMCEKLFAPSPCPASFPNRRAINSDRCPAASFARRVTATPRARHRGTFSRLELRFL